MIDCHIHSIWSDGEDKLEDIVQNAIFKGLEVIGFSDHALSTEGREEHMGPEKVKDYLEKLNVLGGKYAGQIKILSGLEVDYSIGNRKEIEESLRNVNPDFVLAAIHKVRIADQNISLWDYKDMNAPDVVEKYFRNIYSAIETGIFDGIAHPDLINHAVDLPTSYFDQLVDLCKESGVAFEMNAAGLTRDVYDLTKERLVQKSRYPSKDLMRKLVEKGVNLTIGSDAHKIEYVGGNITPIIETLKEVGAENLCYIESRRKVKFQI